jgi:hypothetical protein
MNTFEQYLALYEIDPIRLSIEAKVRYAAVWNAQKGNPISLENAQKLKGAVYKMTGVPYTDSFVLIKTEPSTKLPSTPIKKIHLRKQGNYTISRYCRSGTGS